LFVVWLVVAVSLVALSTLVDVEAVPPPPQDVKTSRLSNMEARVKGRNFCVRNGMVR
jgi:hypothetical protein